MMKAVAVLALLAACVAVALGSGENVLTLTAANFDQTINNNEFVLVEFFAPWCGHCKTLAPEFEKAAAILKKDGVILGAVDSTIERDLAGQFGVRGYPTLKLFRNGKPEEYKGGRTEATIVSWIRKATGPAAKNIIGQGAIIDFSQDNKVAVVGFFEENSEELKAFMSAASGDDTAAYAYSTSSTDAAANGATFPGMILFKKFDEGKNVFSGSLTLESIKSFVQTNSVPLVIDFDMSVVGSIFQSKVGKVAFLFSETPNTDFNELAQEFRGQLVFARANSKEPRLNQHIGIEPSQFPKLFILDTSANMVKYPAPGGVSKEEMKNHIARFLAGEAEAHFKSEEIPVPNDGPVTVVVGKNWQQVVLDEEKDVLLEIYAPWCGHCKKLEPIWNELGTHYQDNKNVVIAKMDGTANEVADVNVRGFPTIKFYPAGKKDNKGLDYDGGREYDDFVNYLNTHGKAKNHDEL